MPPTALRRLAFVAVLAAGAAMLVSSLVGLAGMSEDLRAAGAPVESRLVSSAAPERDAGCDGSRPAHWTRS